MVARGQRTDQRRDIATWGFKIAVPRGRIRWPCGPDRSLGRPFGRKVKGVCGQFFGRRSQGLSKDYGGVKHEGACGIMRAHCTGRYGRWR